MIETLEDRLTPTTQFLGVAAGDPTSHDAILWTRAQDTVSTAGVGVMAQVSTDQTFGSGLATFAGTTDATQDYTIHVDATGLLSNTRYFYRFVASDNVVSQIGTFTTAPDPTAQVGVKFGFTGDADGLMRPYDATSNVTAPGTASFASQNFNYFVWLGDTIYETASGSSGNNNSPATPSTSTASNIDPNNPGALATLESAYWTKYKQQLQPVSTGSYAGLGDSSATGLQGFFDSTGHYTLLDNHELGNKQLINGGAPAGSNPVGIGVDATNTANDVNTSGTYINQSPAFQTVEQAYYDYQPIRYQTVSAPSDPRSNGTEQLYFNQQWGANTTFFNLDDRSYRDIRLKQAANPSADDTGVRADNPNRTMLGSTQLSWVEQGLLAAQNSGVAWKLVAISSPIDQIGPIGGSFTINNSGDASTTQPGYSTSESDGGKSWMGGYRAERNALLKYIADNHISHVVFLSTDDHQLRINELGYFTQFDANGTPIQSSYTRVPGAFEIVAGPIGATGPDTVTDHSIANIQTLAQSFSSQQQNLGIDPIGLDPSFPGLSNVSREGDPNANASRSAFDFYSPDTFNYASLSVDPTGHNLTVTINGINSYATKTFPQPDPNNPVRQILQFTITTNTVQGQASSFNNLTGAGAINGPVATFTDPNATFQPGNLLVSRSVYSGNAGTVTVGNALPGAGGLTATTNGAYPSVFDNEAVDASFGVTSPIFLDQLTTSGNPVGNPLNVTAALGNTLSTSFPSKSELSLNLSADGTAVTFMGYASGVNQLDISNTNTPGVNDPTNLVGLPPVNTPATSRAVVQIDANGNLSVTNVNAYSGNNGRAAILGSNGDYYLVGNAGNGGFTIPGSITTTTGNTTVTLNPATAFETTGIFVVGDLITGKNIPANATVASIVDATHFTISAAATGSGSDNKAKIVQSGTTLSQLSDNTGVQMVVPGGGPNTTVVGQVNGTNGSSTGYQRGFTITQTNPLTGQPYSNTADKTGKDDNFRGETIFNNTLYVTKGSGGNGIDTVYQVGTAGNLPTLANAGTTPITILPGFPTGLAANMSNSTPALAKSTEFHPFGIWFANSTTLYVADEGDGTLADAGNPNKDPNAGLEKWSLVNGVWQLDYVLQNGLDLGVPYGVANGPNGEVYPANLDPATDGLRNLTGKVNPDGTVTLYAITSTVSSLTDQGADPNKLVAITDNLSFTTTAQATGESFNTLKTAGYGEVLRGVSFTPAPVTSQYPATVNWGDGTASTAGVVTYANGTYTVSAAHNYNKEGKFTITTTITHQGATTTLTGTAILLNAAPTGANNTVTTAENQSYTFKTADFGYSDPNNSPANNLKAVEITTLPSAGTLTDNGVAVTAGQFVSVADISGGKLKFTPVSNAYGNPAYATFTFQVQDDGGTANGGADTDPSPKTMTINVPVTGTYQHVLMISVDGLRAADLTDPALAPYLSNFKALQASGTTYANAATSSPSDSFPGELSYLTGAGPGTTGVFYDDSYSRTLFAPALVGSNVPGTEAQFAENIDFNSNNLSGTNSSTVGYGASAIDPAQLPLSSIVPVSGETDTATTTTATTTTYQLQNAPIENDGQVIGAISVNGNIATFGTTQVPGLGSDVVSLWFSANGTNLTGGTLNLSSGLLTLTWSAAPAAGSQTAVTYNYGVPVYPNNYLQTNTIFQVAQAAGLPTAMTDKHPAYLIGSGPNGAAPGNSINDLFTPEINSNVALANTAHALVPGSNIMTKLVDSTDNTTNLALSSTTKSVSLTEANDDLKLQAVLNEIKGKNSLGTTSAAAPALFTFEVQAVSVGQKVLTGGISKNAQGAEVISSDLANAFSHTNASLGQVIAALKANNGNSNLANFNNTLVVLTAKHGQNPRVGKATLISGDPLATALTNAGVGVAQTTEDDVALIWLTDQTQTAAAVAALNAYNKTSTNHEIQNILFGQSLINAGYGDPTQNSRTPDLIVTLKPGFVYGKNKIAEHGGFNPDDTHVALIVASGNAALAKNQTVVAPVSTTQVAVTALQALGLNPGLLLGAVAQGTQALPTPGSAAAPKADLSITSVAQKPGSQNGQQTFIITVQNAASVPGVAVSTVKALTLVDKILDSHNAQAFVPGSVSFVPSSGIYNSANGNWAVTLAPGSSASLAITGTLTPQATQGSLYNSATVTAPAGTVDPKPINNTVVSFVAPSYNVSVSPMTDNVNGSGQPGNPVTYSFTVTNNGTTAVNGVAVVDKLPTGLQAGNYTTSVTGGATVAAGTGTNVSGINTTVNLPAGATVTFNITATIDPAFAPASLSLANTATIATPGATTPSLPPLFGPYFGPYLLGGFNVNSSTATTDTLSLTPTADLGISIADNSAQNSVTGGGSLSYFIYVTNNGPSTVTGASVNAFIDTQLTGVSVSGGNSPTVNNGFLSDTLNLTPGATVTYSVTGTAPASGSLFTFANVTPPGNVTDPNGNNDSAQDSTAVQAADPGDQGLQQIQHFVVIYQENWSFDALYGNFPGANGLANASPTSLEQIDRLTGLPYDTQLGTNNFDLSVNGPQLNTPPQPTNNGQIDPNLNTGINTLQPYNLANYISPGTNTGDIVHKFYQEQSQINAGAQNQYMTWSDNPGLVMSNFDATNMPEGLLAQQYTMDDNFFHAAFGGSFLNHQFLIAAQAPVYPNAATLNAGALPTLDATGQLALNPTTGKIVHDGSITPIGSHSIADPNGPAFDKNYVVNTTFSKNLAPSFIGNNTAASLMPSQNDSNPNDPNRPYIPTIGDTLNQAGVSWKWYSGGWNAALASSPSNPANNGKTPANAPVDANFQWHHQPFAYYDNFAPWLPNGQVNPMSAAHLQDETNFFNDLSGNNLPAVSFVKQVGEDNEHPGYANVLQGQQSTADIVHAIQNSPEWANTAIIITYDENGGRWDHVSAPDANGIWGDGTRVPTIVISPYAKQGYVDDTQYDTLSILKTVENRFNLHPLSQYDANAASLANSFTNVANVSLNQAYVQPDANNIGKYALIVEGTQGNDNIQVTQSSGQITVTINGNVVGNINGVPVTSFDATTISRIEVYGQTGSDTITVDPSITAQTYVFGGSGGGMITANGGNAVIVGGRGGSTTISAGPNSIVIGGGNASAAANLTSVAGSDILIPGTTIYDSNLPALERLLAEWTSNDTYAQKVADISGANTTTGSFLNTRFSTPYFLNAGTVSSNQAGGNVLTGGGNSSNKTALDWFFASFADEAGLTDYFLPETKIRIQ